jgi:small-conductance mechanosensitive channel
MKKTIFILIIAIFVVTTAFVSCKPATKEEIEAKENVQDAEADVQDAKEDLSEAKREATAEEWKAFKNYGDSIVNKNDERIAELKLKIKKAGKSTDAKYEENIDALEQKNKVLKVKMATYKKDAHADWQSFKREFDHDIDELGNAIKDLTVDNKK